MEPLHFGNFIYHGCGRGITWVTLAKLSKIPILSIYQAAVDHNKIGIDFVRRLARGLGIPTSALVLEVERWTPKPHVLKNPYAAGAFKKPGTSVAASDTPKTPRIAPRSFEAYQPPRWNVRFGGEAHKEIKSLCM